MVQISTNLRPTEITEVINGKKVVRRAPEGMDYRPCAMCPAMFPYWKKDDRNVCSPCVGIRLRAGFSAAGLPFPTSTVANPSL